MLSYTELASSQSAYPLPKITLLTHTGEALLDLTTPLCKLERGILSHPSHLAPGYKA